MGTSSSNYIKLQERDNIERLLSLESPLLNLPDLGMFISCIHYHSIKFT